MTWLYAVFGRAALLGAVMLTVLVYLGDPRGGWMTLLVLGLGLIHAGCELGMTRQSTPRVDPPQRGA